MEKRGDGYTTEYDEHRFSCSRPVKLSLIVQTTKYLKTKVGYIPFPLSII
jgi:hypothetical protein